MLVLLLLCGLLDWAGLDMFPGDEMTLCISNDWKVLEVLKEEASRVKTHPK